MPEPMGAALPGTPVDATEVLRTEIDSLTAHNLHELRSAWRQQLRSAPPRHLTRPLLLRLLAYKLQARVHGDLDTTTAAYLDRVARDHARRRIAGEKRPPKAPPPVPPVPRERVLKPGTLLVRHHRGEQHRVVVLPDGFLWEGRTFSSLSEVARAITGTRWSGPRFFGLRSLIAERQKHGAL